MFNRLSNAASAVSALKESRDDDDLDRSLQTSFENSKDIIHSCISQTKLFIQCQCLNMVVHQKLWGQGKRGHTSQVAYGAGRDFAAVGCGAFIMLKMTQVKEIETPPGRFWTVGAGFAK